MTNQPAETSILTEEANRKLRERYMSGYRTAGAVNMFGGFFKFASITIGALIVIVGLISLQEGIRLGTLEIWILVGAGVVAGIVFALGLLIQSGAQLQIAALDSAVHSSPFLSDKQKAIIMGLSVK